MSEASSFDLPAAGPFKRVKELPFDDALRILLTLLKEPPPGFEHLKGIIPDGSDADDIIEYINGVMGQLKKRPQIAEYQTKNGVTDDEVKALHAYKIESPYPVYKWLNAWLMSSRRDEDVKNAVGPFFIILNRAMSKLPKVKSNAARAIQVRNIPALRATFENHKQRCAPAEQLSFWGFASFSTDDTVINSHQFMGAVSEEAIIFSCGSLEGVDMEPFAPSGMKEKEILPMCPAIFEVVTAVMIGSKLSIAVKQLDNSPFVYVRLAPGSNTSSPTIITAPPPLQPAVTVYPSATLNRQGDDDENAVRAAPSTDESAKSDSDENDEEAKADDDEEEEEDVDCQILIIPGGCDDEGFVDLVSSLEDAKSLGKITSEGDYNNVVNITDTSLRLIGSKFPNLKTLELQHCTKISDLGLRLLAPLEHLTCLNFHANDQITHAGVKHITLLPGLTSLSLYACDLVDDEALEYVSSLTNLTSLELCWLKKITSKGLGYLTTLTKLTYLGLGYTTVDDDGWKHLAKLPLLTNLYMQGATFVTKTKLAPIAKLTHLTSLELDCTDVTDEHLVNIGKLHSLKNLSLNVCSEITDAGLKNLFELEKVESISLASSEKITDEGKKQLAAVLSSCEVT